MKIVIKTGNDKIDKKRRITLVLPTFLIKSKIICKVISNNVDSEDEYLKIRYIIKTTYKELRKYIKENGHFKLLEVKSDDGDVTIIL